VLSSSPSTPSLRLLTAGTAAAVVAGFGDGKAAPYPLGVRIPSFLKALLCLLLLQLLLRGKCPNGRLRRQRRMR